MKFQVPALRTVAAVASLAFLAACSKDDENIPSGMSWSLDGSSTTAARYNAQVSGSTLNIAGFPSSSNIYDRSILLEVPKRTGTFDLAGTEVDAAYFSNSSTVYSAVSGTIKITKYSTTNVTGTFSFRATSGSGSSREISNGKFNIDY